MAQHTISVATEILRHGAQRPDTGRLGIPLPAIVFDDVVDAAFLGKIQQYALGVLTK